jgi:arylsulfatase A-like enzyme
MLSGRDHGGAEAAAATESWLLGEGDAPVFCFANLMEVHSPYDPPARFHPVLGRGAGAASWVGSPRTAYYQFRQMGRFRTRTDARYVSTMRSLYFASARYEDVIVGRFVDAILRRGRPSVVVLVSDHGENLGDHGLWGHHSSLNETLLHVPLITWGPGVGLGEGRVEGPVSTRSLAEWMVAAADRGTRPIEPDVGPVIAEYESAANQFGATLPAELGTGGRGMMPQLVSEPGIAVRTDREKYIAVRGGAEFLFDLAADPREERNLLEARPDAAERFRPFVGDWRERREVQRQVELDEVASEEIAAHLQDLGYID